MTITTRTADAEGAVKRWIDAGAVPTLATHAFFGFPTGNPALPLVTIAKVIGTRRADGLEDVVLRLDVWATSKDVAWNATSELTDALMNDAEGVALDDGTWCHGVSSVTSGYLPDPSKLRRYSLTVGMTVEARELP